MKGLIRKFLKKEKDYHDTALSGLFEHVDLTDKKVLIVGLGQGLEVPIFLSRGCASIVAVEPFPVVKEADFGNQFQLHAAPAEDMPLEDNVFDVVYTLASLEHMTDPFKAVKEMVRVLKTDGILFCSAGPFWYSAYGYHAKPKYPLLYDPWFHILFDDAESYINSRNDLDEKHKRHIHNIYNSDGYNRKTSQVYYDIAADLITNHFPLEVNFSMHPEAMLKENSQLDKFNKRDLLTSGFTMIFSKSSA